MTYSLVLLRHGQSTWNLENRFTGWYDADLTDQGRSEAAAGGRAMAEAGVAPDVLHTSLQVRAIRTAELALDAMGLLWLPVHRSWRLNERHYGDLQGKDKKQTTDVVARMMPYWYDAIVPDLGADRTVLVTAHGNSLRALVKHLDDISDEDIAELNLPTGVPMRFELGDDFMPVERGLPIEDRYLGDVEAAKAAAEAVARQAG